MARAFYKDVRMTETLSRLFLSPKIIGAALLFLGCFLYVVKDYTPNWKLEKEKGNLNKKDFPTLEPVKTSKNNFLLLPFVPLAFAFLLIRLFWALFRISIFYSIDGFLWTLVKIPSLFSWYINYLSHLPEIVKQTIPRRWERYVITPSTVYLDYCLEVFFKHVVPMSNLISRFSFGLFRKVLNYLHGSIHTIWDFFHSLIFAAPSSFTGPLLQACRVFCFDSICWVTSRGSSLGKRIFQYFQVLAFDFFSDIRDLCYYTRKMGVIIQAFIKPTVIIIVRNLKTLTQRIFDHCFQLVPKVVPVWDRCVQKHILPTGQRIRGFYHDFLTTFRKHSITLTLSIWKVSYRSLKVAMLWIWRVALPKSRMFMTNGLRILYDKTYSILSQAYHASKYFYCKTLKRVYNFITQVHSYTITTALRLHRVARHSFRSSLKYTKTGGIQLWIPVQKGIVHSWKQMISLTFLTCRKIKQVTRSVLPYLVKSSITIVSSNLQSLISSSKPLFSRIRELYQYLFSLSLDAGKNVGKGMHIALQWGRAYLWPTFVEYVVKSLHTISECIERIIHLAKEGYHEIQPIIVSWKESIVYAADEVIQYLGCLMVDWIKAVKSKQE
ncbi:hypothetical protein K7432_003167 [Basidiobolus ranarum]|uniref:Uncharacterized protein n=1 Tax=Basidiobolus ranarum TaxID=34480 RepID=A0ABR2X0A6_9FUNG